MSPTNFATAADYASAAFIPLKVEGAAVRNFPVPTCWICGKAATKFTAEDNAVPGYVVFTALCHGGREREIVPREYLTEPGWTFARRLVFAPAEVQAQQDRAAPISFVFIIR